MTLLEMENITKSFFGVTILDRIHFSVEKGEVHALLGENGAGKSSLMNILTGIYVQEEGTVKFEEKDISHIKPLEAQKMGIGFVHQELNLFNDLKVYENIYLTEEIQTKTKKLDKKAMIQGTKELFKKLNININPTALLGDLDLAGKQLVEIAKVLHKKAKLIILDEPTTSLNNKEIDTLFNVILGLKEQGTSFVYISHKMPEIFRICDRYTVLRNGKFIKSGNIKDTDTETATKLMVGSNYEDKHYQISTNYNESVLQVKNISGNKFKNISFDLKKGEVIAFTGLAGSGGSEILESIFGYLPITDGEMYINDTVIRKTGVKKSMKAGLALVPSNRKENGIVPDMNLLDNMMVSKYSITNRKQHINREHQINLFERMRVKLNIQMNHWSKLITSLSGGNQQKVIIGRWLLTDADIYIFDNPTQGIDVGAKAEIYQLIMQLVQHGKSVIINTLEIPEIEKIANRCFVLYQGEIVKRLSKDEISEEQVMLHATDAIVKSPKENEYGKCEK